MRSLCMLGAPPEKLLKPRFADCARSACLRGNSPVLVVNNIEHIRRDIPLAKRSHHTSTDRNQHENFFRFTRGRFVYDEAEQMAMRYRRFDVNALCKIAGDAVGKTCVHVEKCADGLYNKALLLSMDDQTQVVAKIPNPNAGQTHLTTASEVATMDFMRNVLKTPVPQVLSWSSCDDNAVGAEYIIMEKAQGVQLQSVWPRLNIQKKAKVVKSIGRLQQAWTKVSFKSIGNLYYANSDIACEAKGACYVDTDSSEEIPMPQFVVGPTVGREWVDLGRAALPCDRGPWSSSSEYRRAMIEKEMQAVRDIERLPKSLSLLCGPGLYQPDRKKKLRAGELAVQTLPHWLPTAPWASTFHIWHNDLHAENIFVDPNDPATITSIIDWQSAHISPLFDQSIFPGYLNSDAPAVKGMDRPTRQTLPANAGVEQRIEAERLYDAQVMAHGFKLMLRKHMPPAFEALMYDESDKSDVLTFTRRLFEFGEAHCVAAIARLSVKTAALSEAEIAEATADVQRVENSIRGMNAIAEALGPLFPHDGVVRHDEYKDVKAALRDAKAGLIEEMSESPEDRAAWEEGWPFDD